MLKVGLGSNSKSMHENFQISYIDKEKRTSIRGVGVNPPNPLGPATVYLVNSCDSRGGSMQEFLKGGGGGSRVLEKAGPENPRGHVSRLVLYP